MNDQEDTTGHLNELSPDIYRATIRQQFTEPAALRQEIERLTTERDARDVEAGIYCAKWEDIQAKLAQAEQRIAELEQALRLHLAVAPDDPILLTPVEQQLAKVMQDLAKECDRSEALGAACADGTNQIEQLQAALARVEGELSQCKGNYEIQKYAADQAEQREARLREALEDAIATERRFADARRQVFDKEGARESEYAFFVLNQLKQQALNQLSTDGQTKPIGKQD